MESIHILLLGFETGKNFAFLFIEHNPIIKLKEKVVFRNYELFQFLFIEYVNETIAELW